MREAIMLSALGLGRTSPNPPVGCVILNRGGRVVGRGYHERKGEPHAEAIALADAGSRARGGTAVVTLEPCNHQGRTPPCHQALIDAGIRRVVVALIDPTSRGEGGVTRLRAAGLDVEVDALREEALVVLKPWLFAQTHAVPYLIWPCTTTSDDLVVGLGYRPDALDLRSGADVVLNAGGVVTEAVVGAHGSGVLRLDDVTPTDDADATLRRLYTAGARIALLDADREAAEPYLAHPALQRVDFTTSSLSPDLALPTPLTIRTLERRRDHHRLIAER